MKLAIACLLCLFALSVQARGNTSHYIDKLSCDSGPYSLKLPKTYDALRKIGPLKSERVLREEDFGPYKARHRDLVFNGLRLSVVTYSNDQERYQVTAAEIRNPSWRISPFRQGHVLPVKVGDVVTQSLSSTATIEFSGEEDTVRVRLIGRRISVLTYLCVPD